RHARHGGPHRQGPAPPGRGTRRRLAATGAAAARGRQRPGGRAARGRLSAMRDPRALLVLYGGTFDPVHLGHVAVARAARDALAATVAFMPAADPPHRAPP